MTKSPDNKPKKISTEPYKGVRDFYPEDLFTQNYIFNIWRKTTESFGYVEYSASILEPSELYEAKSGAELVNEQTYKFIDRGERSVTLRPEMTPTVARMVAARKRELAFPLRWYSIPNLFRYERPQKGRLREHYQLNVDLFGVETVDAEVEIVTLAHQIMKNFGAKDSDFIIKISSRKLLNAVFNNWYELDPEQSESLRRIIDKKAKMEPEEFQKQAGEIAGKAFNFLDFAKNSPDYQEAMAFPEIREAKMELDKIKDILISKGLTNVVLDADLVRGFDYYTGFVFEVFDSNSPNKSSIFGGGRYDDILAIFGEEKVPAVGFGLGDVRVQTFLEDRNLVPKYKSPTEILIAALDEESTDFANKIAGDLREKGHNVVLDLTYRKIADQIRKAEKQSILSVVFIGQDEVKSKTYKIKNLETGQEKEAHA